MIPYIIAITPFTSSTIQNIHVIPFLLTARRLRSGPRQVRADEDVLQRGGDAVVPPARRAARLHRVLHAHRHVGRRMHFLRDGLGQAALPGIHRRGRAPPDIQGNKHIMLLMRLSQ